MKTIGLLGGMSWESTALYYEIINKKVQSKLGYLHSAKLTMFSVDFNEIERLQHSGDWDKLGKILAHYSQNIESSGADFLVICTNTMHKVAPQIQKAITIPILHIADSTAKELVKDGIKKVGLLGTAFTMKQDFYKGRLQEKFNLEVLTPTKDDRELIHKVIYNELCLGIYHDSSKQEYLRVINDLKSKGAEGIILGCTEIGLLVNQNDTNVKLYDTTDIHAKAAVNYAIEKRN